MKEHFLPDFSGCVVGDFHTVKAVERLCREELEAVATYLYRETLIGDGDPELGAFFEEQAQEAAYHFRFLGSLLLAMGGDLSLRTQIRLHGGTVREREESRRAQNFLYDSLCEKRRLCALYRSVMEGCEDGVVRSALSCLLEDEERSEMAFQRFFG